MASRITNRPAATARPAAIETQSPPFRQSDLAQAYIDETRRPAASAAVVSDLAREFWPDRDATMRAAAGYFTGDYDRQHPGHKCRASVQMTLTAEGVSYHRMTSKLWRARQLDNGFRLDACPGCLHERALRACRQIEAEAVQFDLNVAFRFAVLPLPAASAAVATITTWGKRYELDLRYWLRPLSDGTAALVHNVQHAPTKRTAGTFATFSGDELPQDKSALFDLVHGWHAAAGDGRERHSKQWGGDFSGNKGDGRQKGGDGDELPDDAAGGDVATAVQPLPAVTIIVKWTARVRQEITAYLYHRHGSDAYKLTLPARGKLPMTGPELIRLFDAAGIDYGVTAGADLLATWRDAAGVQSPPSEIPFTDSEVAAYRQGVLPC